MEPDDDRCAWYRRQERQEAAPGVLAGRRVRDLGLEDTVGGADTQHKPVAGEGHLDEGATGLTRWSVNRIIDTLAARGRMTDWCRRRDACHCMHGSACSCPHACWPLPKPAVSVRQESPCARGS